MPISDTVPGLNTLCCLLPPRRYSKITESSKAYVITQYGLSCFEATGPASYEARTFNFYVFPHPHGGYNRRFMCDASSLVFLASHGVCRGGGGAGCTAYWSDDLCDLRLLWCWTRGGIYAATSRITCLCSVLINPQWC